MARLIAVTACSMLLLTACGGKAPSDAPSAPVSVPDVTAPETPAPTVEEAKPPTVDEWNDKALKAINEQKWKEAIDAANQALALDSENAATWFNLGRGQLGAGQAKEAAVSLARAHGLLEQTPNVDVEFFLATALEASGQPMWALSVYERALKLWPDDPDLPRAIADLKQQHDLAVLSPADPVDIDGDGRPDLFEVTEGLVRITAADGKVLLEEAAEQKTAVPQVYVYPIRGTATLVRIAYPCMSGSFNTMYWYDRTAMVMKPVEGGGVVGGVCLAYQYLGDGRFEEAVSVGEGNEQVVTQRWESGQWVKEGTVIRPRGK